MAANGIDIQIAKTQVHVSFSNVCLITFVKLDCKSRVLGWFMKDKNAPLSTYA